MVGEVAGVGSRGRTVAEFTAQVGAVTGVVEEVVASP